MYNKKIQAYTYQYRVASNEVDYVLTDFCCRLLDTAQLELMSNACEHAVAISSDVAYLQIGSFKTTGECGCGR